MPDMEENIMEKKITVLIPTYNRKESLSRTLRDLESQTRKDFYVVISDNASDYDVKELLNQYNESFRENCRIYRRKRNVGANTNILGIFGFCDTRYAWTLSDDDYISRDAIEKIYKTIEKVGKFGCIDFTISNFKGMKRINNIEEFVDFYYQKALQGANWFNDLIYLSNKVYDMEIVDKYIIYGVKYNYSGIASVIIYAKMLEAGVPFIIDKEDIVQYNADTERSWRVCEIVLGSRTLKDVPFDCDVKMVNRLLYCISFNINAIYYLYFVESENIHNERGFFDQLYHGLYKYILPAKQKRRLWIIKNMTQCDIGYRIIRRLFISRYNGMWRRFKEGKCV